MSLADWLIRPRGRVRSRSWGRPRRDRVPQGWAGDRFLEDRVLLAGVVMPSDTVSSDIGVKGVLYDGGLVTPTAATQQYVKRITVTNNGSETIYPFLEDANNRTATPGDPTPAPDYTGTGMFDPFDALNQEYRGYIGYTQQEDGGTVTYMGLLPGSSITINVPLVFWDAGRIIITTDSGDLKGTGGNGNPFLYRDQNTQVTYYGSVGGNTLSFTPVYKSFAFNAASNDYEPSAADWTPPTDLASGMKVNGPGIPGGTTITVGGDSHSVTLNPPPGTSITTPTGVQQFTFTSDAPISSTLRYSQPGYTITTAGSSAANGVVMWYHALTAENPSNDAPFQLIEMSFRGTFYDPKINVGTGFNYLIGFDTDKVNYISANDFDLVNYDVSYVDAIALPVALEAGQVPIPNTSQSKPFGWVGSSLAITELQSAFEAFTGSSSSLGTYFGGQGYPSYYAPPGVDTIKLPSGQNLFFQSPLNTGSNLSSFSIDRTFADGSNLNLPLYALTDGGTGPFSMSPGGDTDPNIPSPAPTQLVLHHTTDADKNLLELLSGGIQTYQFQLTAIDGQAVPGGTYITDMLFDPANPHQLVGVVLNQGPGVSDPPKHVFTFSRPAADPIAKAIASVWYSWANYYATTVASTPPSAPVQGSIAAGSNVLVLAAATTGLVPGMAVTDAQGTSHGVITAVGADNRTIALSQSQAGALVDGFNFAGPSVASLVGYDPGGLTPIMTYAFPAGDDRAMAFAQNVYVVMSTMGRTVKPNTPNAAIPLLGNIIGGNVGPAFLPDQNAAIQAAITDRIKSALRGVPDFTSPAYSNPSQWYPDPALAAGGQAFNVYNLDPFIWFIHQKLGLSAYAFGLDDDIGDVGAGGSTHLVVGVGGLGGLPTQDPGSPTPYPFANTANYGPVQATLTTAPAAGSSVLAGLPLGLVNQLVAANFSTNAAGTLVNGPGVPIGTTVLTFDSTNGTVTLSSPLTKIPPGLKSYTYSFYGPVVGTGTVLGAGQPANTIRGLDPDAYNTLLKLGPLSNVQVTGPGIDPGEVVTVAAMFVQDGVPVVVLSDRLDPSRISEVGGSFAYTFGYAALSPIVDGGFEQPTGVANVTGGFLHGPQLAPPGGDQPWTFTDASGTSFAGIAGNGSVYTKNNGPAPQGLQVAFIQGGSSISQTITLAQGSYTLSLVAVQAATNSAPQVLTVLVDGVPVGTINPKGPKYAPFSIPFSVGPGAHTITFQGAASGSGTVLLDAISFGPPASLAGAPGRPQPLPPAAVEFLSPPAGGTARSPLSPVVVQVLDRAGKLVDGVRVRLVLVRVGKGSRGHLARGSVVFARTKNGVATFNRLAITAPGRYVIRIKAGLRRHADSAPFDVGPRAQA
ncbi:hypothetical protein OJF2_76830 [Aquisphaera giovannonii]|uniref:Uncharacterized protein n=2 Tax=Aquisphaera giovannonii TaxID=406548 RepID=A0A5B9WGD5_9BACT|nr:hypothetical protein OJF2_76830 [Aquisphaera giovannonii]